MLLSLKSKISIVKYSSSLVKLNSPVYFFLFSSYDRKSSLSAWPYARKHFGLRDSTWREGDYI